MANFAPDKRPQSGKLQIAYSFNVNLQAPDLSSYSLLNGPDFLETQRLAGIYTYTINHYNGTGLQQWYNYRLAEVKRGVNTYWLSQPVQVGVGTRHSVSMTGGIKAVRFSLNLNYTNGVGVMKGSGRDAFAISSNFAYNTSKIRLSNNIGISYGRSSITPWGSYFQYAKQFPYFRAYDSSGNVVKTFEPTAASLGYLVSAPGGIFTNTMYNSTLNVQDNSNYTSVSNATQLEWIINRNLRFNSGINLSTNLPAADQFMPADHTQFTNASLQSVGYLGSYSQTRANNQLVDAKASLDYNRKFDKHLLFVSLGGSMQQTTSSSSTVSVAGIPNDYLSEIGLANGYPPGAKINSTYLSTRSLSTYGSVSYSYNERYTVEATGNASGSSQFGANNRFAPFWAYGAGWNVDKEKFFTKNDIIQQLRLRVTYGITGNQNFAAFIAQPIYNYNLYYNYRLQLGANLQGYANPDLKWQQTKKFNTGIAMSLFKSALNASINLYVENTDNLIVPIGIQPSTGFITYSDNLGATKNTGYELSLSAPIIKDKRRNIFWSLTFNTGHVNNVITKLSPAIEEMNKVFDATDGTVSQKKPLPKYKVGQSMTEIWAVKSLGIDPATGNEVFQKLDGSKTFIWDPSDKQPVGDANSKVKGTLGSNLTYGGFVFNLMVSYAYGGQMYNSTLVDKVENVDLRTSNADTRVFTDRWKKPGDIAQFKSIAAYNIATNTTSRFVQDNNFLDLTSLTIGYNFPPNLNWVKRLKLSTPRLAITQNNFIHIGTIKTERGTSYPFARTFSLGLSTMF